jgi:hypothetical protein
MSSSKVQPIRKSVVVNTGVEHAFALFINKFDAIKPREHNLLSVPIAETVFEPRVGGHIYDVGIDGTGANGRVSSPMSRRPASFFHGTLDRPGNWKTTPPRRVRSRCASSLSPVIALGWSWSIDTLSAMAPAGEPSPTESMARRAGRFTSAVTSR